MIPQLCDQDLIARPPVNDPVFGCNSAGPESGQGVFQRLRFPDAAVRLADDFFQEQVNSIDGPRVSLLPVKIILPGLGGENEIHQSALYCPFPAFAALQGLHGRKKPLRIRRRPQQIGGLLQGFVFRQRQHHHGLIAVSRYHDGSVVFANPVDRAGQIFPGSAVGNGFHLDRILSKPVLCPAGWPQQRGDVVANRRRDHGRRRLCRDTGRGFLSASLPRCLSRGRKTSGDRGPGALVSPSPPARPALSWRCGSS